jgi:hypothetical protein
LYDQQRQRHVLDRRHGVPDQIQRDLRADIERQWDRAGCHALGGHRSPHRQQDNEQQLDLYRGCRDPSPGYGDPDERHRGGPGAIQIAPATPGDAGNGTDTGATCSLTAAQKAANAVTSCVIYDQRFIEISSALLTALATANGFTTAFELIESTLSAHAFNFYVQAPGGTYEFDVNAQLFVGKNNTAPASSVAGCFGPGTVTVTQVKNFSFNTPIRF